MSPHVADLHVGEVHTPGPGCGNVCNGCKRKLAIAIAPVATVNAPLVENRDHAVSETCEKPEDVARRTFLNRCVLEPDMWPFDDASIRFDKCTVTRHPTDAKILVIKVPREDRNTPDLVEHMDINTFTTIKSNLEYVRNCVSKDDAKVYLAAKKKRAAARARNLNKIKK